MTLDNKTKEIENNFNSQLELMQKVNKETQDKLVEITTDKEKLDSVEENFISKTKELEDFKNKFKTEVSSFQNETQEKTNNLLNEYNEKLRNVNLKLNSTLELATKILEGLVQATEKKVNDYYDKRFNSFVDSINNKLQIDSKIKEEIINLYNKVEKLEIKIPEIVNKKLNEILFQYNIDVDIKNLLSDLSERIKNLEKQKKEKIKTKKEKKNI